MKLTKNESAAFEAIGAAYCEGKECAKLKKETIPAVKDVIAKNHDAFLNGVTLGNYKFVLVVREELTAIRI